MSEVILKHIKKVYPNTEKKRKKGSSEKKSNLLVTDEGVVAVQDFNLDIKDKEFIVLLALPDVVNQQHCVWWQDWRKSQMENS